MTGMIKRFESHSGSHGTVSNDGNIVMLLPLHSAGNHHAQDSADGGAGMANPKGIVVAFLPIGECGETSSLAHG